MRYLRIALAAMVMVLGLVSAVDAAIIGSNGKNTVSLSGMFEEGDSTKLLKSLGELTITGSELHLYINSPGGDSNAYKQIKEMLTTHCKTNKLVLVTHAYGRIASAGALLFLMGDIRIIGETASVMLHEAAFYNRQTKVRITRDSDIGKTLDDFFWDQLEAQNKEIKKFIRARAPGLPYSWVLKEKWMTAHDAMKFGVATHIKIQGELLDEKAYSKYSRSTNVSHDSSDSGTGRHGERKIQR